MEGGTRHGVGWEAKGALGPTGILPLLLHLPLCRGADGRWQTGPSRQLKLVKEDVPGTIQSTWESRQAGAAGWRCLKGVTFRMHLHVQQERVKGLGDLGKVTSCSR